MVADYVKAGYTCFIFDGQHKQGVHRVPVKAPGRLYKVGMWFSPNDLRGDVDRITLAVNSKCPSGWTPRIVFSFPECTYLTVTAARWFYHPDDAHLPTDKRRPHPKHPDRKQKRLEAIELFKLPKMLAQSLWCPYMSENPAISNLNTMYERPRYTFHPYHYGRYLPRNDVHSEYPDNYPGRDAYPKITGIWCSEDFNMPERKAVVPVPGDFHQITKGGGGTTRTKNMRSCTPRGFARAVFLANQ
ncbi:MAG: putative site specific DNA methylase [Caudoviricetes sp.]|nr:MAG: putative site specific DNA methylase [Caudoviricetes sp.]